MFSGIELYEYRIKFDELLTQAEADRRANAVAPRRNRGWLVVQLFQNYIGRKLEFVSRWLFQKADFPFNHV